MFNKNAFKVEFRSWAMLNLQAGDEEAEAFCRANIPKEVQESYDWLMDQSVQWFKWCKQQHNRERHLADDYLDDPKFAS